MRYAEQLPRLDDPLLLSPGGAPSGVPFHPPNGAKAGLVPWWLIWSLTALAISGVWAGAIWASQHIAADPVVHTAALFVHLAALVAGFGAVLFVDYVAAHWLLGRRSVAELLAVTRPANQVIWTGLALLVFSGVLLGPNPEHLPTRIKLAAVLIAGLNGLHATALHHRLAGCGPMQPPGRLVLRAVVCGGVSQLCWWTATIVGFLNAQH